MPVHQVTVKTTPPSSVPTFSRGVQNLLKCRVRRREALMCDQRGALYSSFFPSWGMISMGWSDGNIEPWVTSGAIFIWLLLPGRTGEIVQTPIWQSWGKTFLGSAHYQIQLCGVKSLRPASRKLKKGCVWWEWGGGGCGCGGGLGAATNSRTAALFFFFLSNPLQNDNFEVD